MAALSEAFPPGAAAPAEGVAVTNPVTIGESSAAAPPTSDGAQDATPHPTKPKRAMRRLGVLAGVTALSVGGIRLGQEQLAESWRQTWGTLESPRFRPDETVKLHPIPTFQQNIGGLRESLITNIEKLRASEAELDKLDTKELNPDERTASRAAIRQSLFGSPQVGARSQSTAPGLPDCSPVEYAKQLVERALGTPLPEEMKIVLGDVGIHGMNGFANSYNSKITVESSQAFPSEWANYFETVGTTGHEIGHLIFRYAEERYCGWKPWEGFSYDVNVREEAVAVIFRALVAAQVDDPSERWAIAGNMQSHAELHYDGQADYGLSEGAALADAALTLYPDPYQAFKALTVPGPLDPALYEVVARNREAQKEIAALTQEYSERLQKLYARLEPSPGAQPQVIQTGYSDETSFPEKTTGSGKANGAENALVATPGPATKK
jgi:hypothetical protein